MNDLVEFLLACIAEDERGEGIWGEMEVSGADRVVGKEEHEQVRRIFLSYHRRIAAECEAKRRIVELHHDGGEHQCWEMHRGVYGPGWPEGSYAVEGQPWAHPSLEGSDVHPGSCETLQLLALPYADRPDYRGGEWKP